MKEQIASRRASEGKLIILAVVLPYVNIDPVVGNEMHGPGGRKVRSPFLVRLSL